MKMTLVAVVCGFAILGLAVCSTFRDAPDRTPANTLVPLHSTTVVGDESRLVETPSISKQVSESDLVDMEEFTKRTERIERRRHR